MAPGSHFGRFIGHRQIVFGLRHARANRVSDVAVNLFVSKLLHACNASSQLAFVLFFMFLLLLVLVVLSAAAAAAAGEGGAARRGALGLGLALLASLYWLLPTPALA